MQRVNHIETLPPEELKFLTDLMSATSFKKWNADAQQGWDELASNPNGAHGVRVFRGHLVMLNLSGCGLCGKLPDSVGQCKQLEKLILHNNRTQPKGSKSGQGIIGQIPASITGCESLERLDLSQNSIEGQIPAGLSELTQLDGLYLYDNKLAGSIPSELGALEKLQYLYLGDNAFTGEIPVELTALRQLKHFVAFNNRLTGEVPPAFGDLQKLEILWLFQGEQEAEWTTGTADSHPSCLTGATQDLLGEALWY